MNFLYNISISILSAILPVVALFNSKVRRFTEGRKHTIGLLQEKIRPGDKVLWFHCASLGEFEQGRPVLEHMASEHPGHKIVLSFFSPSGFEIQKNYPGADAVVYLPLDRKKKVREFLDALHPVLAVFVKYEFWPNLLNEVRKREIPAVLISGIFRQEQIFFKPYGSSMRGVLKGFSRFFVQNQESMTLLNGIGIENVTVSGDTRFDRVYEILQQDNHLDFLDDFTSGKKVIVAGSTWPSDEQLLLQHINKSDCGDCVYIIAPHQMDAERMRRLANGIDKKCLLYSQGKPSRETDVLIVDTIGLLTRIYSYATIAMVGGGFDKEGVHNVLEPAVFGAPIIIGPVFDKYQEAVDLVDRKGCLVASDAGEFDDLLDRLVQDDLFREQTGEICADFIQENKGATEIITSYLDQSMMRKV